MEEQVVAGPRIDEARLMDSIHRLAQVGAYLDDATGLQGVRRLALGDADGEARRLVVAWMESAGLAVSIDAIGNVFGRRAGSDDSLDPLMMGSHIDSVPSAGAFDGVLGVLGALEVVRTLNDLDLTTRRPLIAAFFSEEEGCRFSTDMLGSGVATGRIPLQDAWALRDRDGLVVKDELERLGFLGREQPGAISPHAYLECHIEQGPVLASTGVELGVVTGVQAIAWHELTLTGRAAHAGTTPTDHRRDAGLVAARINVALRELVDSGEFGELRATVGRVQHQPGAINVVPGRVEASVDLRNPDDDAMARAEARLFELLDELQRETDVEIFRRRTATTGAVRFDERVRGVIADAAASLGLKHGPILSGAGHDAQEWARVCPAGMVFVPGEYDGISHNPREFSTPEQCRRGVDVLLRAALALADEPPPS